MRSLQENDTWREVSKDSIKSCQMCEQEEQYKNICKQPWRAEKEKEIKINVYVELTCDCTLVGNRFWFVEKIFYRFCKYCYCSCELLRKKSLEFWVLILLLCITRKHKVSSVTIPTPEDESSIVP